MACATSTARIDDSEVNLLRRENLRSIVATIASPKENFAGTGHREGTFTVTVLVTNPIFRWRQVEGLWTLLTDTQQQIMEVGLQSKCSGSRQ